MYPGIYLQENKVSVYNYITKLFKTVPEHASHPEKGWEKWGYELTCFTAGVISAGFDLHWFLLNPTKCQFPIYKQMIMPITPKMYAHFTVIPVCTLTRVTLPQHPCAYSVVW